MNILKNMALVGITAMAFFVGATAHAQEGSAKFSEAEALKLANEWALQVGQADVASLEKLLSDSYIHIHGTALVETKSQFLNAFTTGARKYDPIHLEELSARVFGSSAVVTGKFKLKAFVPGKTLEGVNRFGLVLVKTPGGQEVVSFQATPIVTPAKK